MRSLFYILLMYGLIFCQSSLADGFICYGQGFAYTTKAPKGWKLDNGREKHGGICIVGYPIGGSWENSETVIYINPTTKGTEEGSRGLEDMLAFDLKQQKQRNPNVEIKDGPILEVAGKKVPTKYFYNDKNKGNNEAVAYIDEQKAVIFVAMSSRTRKGFDSSLPAFKEFVQNYKFLTSDVKFEVQKPKEPVADDLKKLIAQAEKDKSGPAGKKYDEDATISIGEKLGASMRKCAPTGTPKGSFNNIFIIDKEGKVLSTEVTKSFKASECLDKELVGVRFPKPPFAPFHLQLEMSIND